MIGQQIENERRTAESRIKSALQDFFDSTGIRASNISIQVESVMGTQFVDGQETRRKTHMDSVTLEVTI